MADTYKGHKPGSRKAIVHQTYDKDGVDAAIAKAAELGLANNTARSWIASWGGKLPKAPKVPKATPAKKQAPKEKTGPAPAATTKGKLEIVCKGENIWLKSDPTIKGKLLTIKATESEVKWSNGNRLWVPNEWFEYQK